MFYNFKFVCTGRLTQLHAKFSVSQLNDMGQSARAASQCVDQDSTNNYPNAATVLKLLLRLFPHVIP